MKIFLTVIGLLLVVTINAQEFLTRLNGPFGASSRKAVITNSGTTIVISESGGIWYLPSNTTTWTKSNTGTDNNFADIDIDPSGNVYAVSSISATVLKSTNAGVSFTNPGSTGLLTSCRFVRAASSARILLVDNNNRLLRSNDGGASFSVASTDISGTTVTDLDVNPNDIDDVYLSTSSQGVKFADDGGFNFLSAPLAVSGSIANTANVLSLVVAGNGVAYALTTTGPHIKSVTTTNNWTSIKGNLTESEFSGRITLDQTATNLIMLNSANTVRKSFAMPVGTTTWTTGVSFPAHIAPSSLIAVTSSQWIVTTPYGGPFLTSNAGAAWTNIAGEMTALELMSVYVTAQNRIFVAYGGTGYYQSIDNGQSWTQQSAAPADRFINGFITVATGVIAYGPSGTLLSTGTIGNTWTAQNTTGLTKVVSNNTSVYDLFAYSGNTIYSTADAGTTWNPVAITGIAGSISDILMDPNGDLYVRASNTLYRVPYGTTTAQSIHTSVTGGTSVARNNPGSILYQLSTNFNLRYSTDQGTNWSSRALVTANSASAVWAFENSTVITSNANTESSVNFSQDGGVTWLKQVLQESTARVRQVALGNSEIAYVVARNAPVYRSTNSIILPKAPTNLELKAFIRSRASILWTDNSLNETAFDVEVSTGTNSSYQLFSTVTNNYFQGKNALHFPVTAGTIYFIRVRARNGAGVSPPTNEITFETPAAGTYVSTIPANRSWTVTTVVDPGYTASGPGPFTLPAVPLQAGGTNMWAGTFLAFNAVPTSPAPQRPQTLDLSFQFMEEFGKVILAGTQASSDITNGTGTWDGSQIVIKWQAGLSYNEFKATTTYTLNASDPVPTTVTASAYPYSTSESLINWTRSLYEHGYKVYRSPTSGGTFVEVGTVIYPGNYFIDKNLTPSTTYYYKVAAYNAAGTGPQSTEKSVALGTPLFRPIENDVALNYEGVQGASWGDFDDDGDEDLASPSFANAALERVPPVLYENKGAGVFTRINLPVVADETNSIPRGIVVADFNNDTKLDMYVTGNSIGTAEDYLLINNGSWNFTKHRIPQSTTPLAQTFRGLAAADFDRDGLLDVYLGNDPGGLLPPTAANTLLRNVDGVSFEKITSPVSTDLLNSRSASFADYDNDGDQDLFTLNFVNAAALANVLYKNNGDGTFTKVTGLSFDTDLYMGARTISWGDIDNDNDLDLFVGNLSADPDLLYRNNGNGTFTLLAGSPVADAGTSTYGSAFGDIDNDGDLDLLVVNSGANGLFLNNGAGTFTKYTGVELITHPSIFDLGGSFVDIDRDGFLDFQAGKGTGGAVDLPNLMYENTLTASASRNWLEIKLVGTVSNTAAIGARIKVTTNTPARTQIREVAALTGYGSQHSLIQHFGLGTATIANSVEVRWPNGKIQTFNNIPINQVVTFTEDATGPEFVVVPANGATGVKVGTTLTMIVNEASVRHAGKLIKVYAASDPATVVTQVDVSAGTIQSNTYTFTLPDKLQINTTYNVVVEAGAFTDNFDNGNVQTPDGSWSFTTAPGPLVSSLLPAHNATQVTTNSNFEITFSGDITAVTGKKLEIKDGTDVLLSIDVGVSGTTIGNKYTLIAPLVLPFFRQLDIVVDAGAFLDVDLNPFKGINTGEWKITTIVEVDNEKPVVTYNPSAIAVLEKGFEPITNLNITATDAKGIASVTFYHKKVNETTFQGMNSTSAANPYTFTITNGMADDMGFQYYIEAKDPTGNIGRSPATGFHRSKLSFTNTNRPVVNVPTQGTPESWSIIAIPYELPVRQVSTLFATLGGSSETTWRLLHYNLNSSNQDEWLEYPTVVNIDRGKGYFINSLLTDKGQVLLDGATSPDNTRDNLFTMSLVRGWNQIGNPYALNINWNDIRAYNNATSTVGALQLFSNGSYVEDPILQTGKGGFVFAQNPVSDFKFSFPGQPAGGRMKEFKFDNLDSESWKVDLTLTQGASITKTGGFGMHADASLQYDELDNFNSPRFFDFIEMNFDHPEHFYKQFSRDVIPTTDEHTWDFTITSNIEGLATISWDNSSLQGTSKDLYLFDVTRHQPYNMKEVDQIRFDPRVSNKFKVYFGSDVLTRMNPMRPMLGEAWPNPSPGITTIPFSLPGNNSKFAVRLEIFDATGAKAATLVNGELNSGFYHSTWHPEKAFSGGLYLYRLTVDNGEKPEILTGKLVLQR